MQKTGLDMRLLEHQRAVGAAGKLGSQLGVEKFTNRGLQQELAKIIGGIGKCLAHQIAAHRAVTLEQRRKGLLRICSAGQWRGREPEACRPALGMDP